MDELENQKQYVNMEQYSNVYLNGRKNNAKRQHPFFRKLLFRCGQGLLFGIFAGFGVYMILALSGVTGRLARVENASQELRLVKEDIFKQ